MNVDPEGFHVGKALLRRPDRPRRNADAARFDVAPFLPSLRSMDETLGCQVSVNVNAAHVYLHTSPVLRRTSIATEPLPHRYAMGSAQSPSPHGRSVHMIGGHKSPALGGSRL